MIMVSGKLIFDLEFLSYGKGDLGDIVFAMLVTLNS